MTTEWNPSSDRGNVVTLSSGNLVTPSSGNETAINKRKAETVEFIAMAIYLAMNETSVDDWNHLHPDREKYFMELGHVAYLASRGVCFTTREERREWLEKYNL